ncbi:MAG: SurA N-terminal domain-containing protein [Deltaproteobacteria bacterium]|nr:MAG: SurA N-terminal domain-containing protein [Deltaproteobacteria bacterium]
MTRKAVNQMLGPVKRCAILAVIPTIVLITRTLGAEVVDRIVAVVNNDIISLYELNQLSKPFIERINKAQYSIEKEQKILFELRRRILNQLIDEKLTDQQLKRYNITASEKEIDTAIESTKEMARITDEDLRAELASQGLTMEDYRKQVKEQLLRRRLINLEIKSKIVITQEDVKAYYESNFDSYRGEKKYHLRNIIMAVPPMASDEEKQAVFLRMEDVLAQLKQGKNFAALAKIYSQSSLASEGGDLGFFRLDELSPQLKFEIQKLKTGEFTPIIDTDMGYQILFVEAMDEIPGKTLEEVSPEITDKLYSQIVDKKYQAWLEDLRSRSHIKIIY